MHRLITPYNSRANGAAEYHVKLFLRAIKKSVGGVQHDWDLPIPGTQLALNTRVSRLHGSAPFSLFFARSFPGFNTAPRYSSPEATKSCELLESSDGRSALADDSLNDWLDVISQMENVIFPAIVSVGTHRMPPLRFNSTKLIAWYLNSRLLCDGPRSDPCREVVPYF